MNCIICLDNKPKTILFNGRCKCKPSVHSECIDEWYDKNDYQCPICRKSFMKIRWYDYVIIFIVNCMFIYQIILFIFLFFY